MYIYLALIIAFLPFSSPTCELLGYLVLVYSISEHCLVRILHERVNRVPWSQPTFDQNFMLRRLINVT